MHSETDSGPCQTSMMDSFAKLVNICLAVNPLTANPTKWSNTLKQFVGKLTTNCLSVFDHFVNLALKELTILAKNSILDI